MDDDNSDEPVFCENTKKDNIFTTLNVFNVRFVGTTSQLYAINPSPFYDNYV